MAPLLIDSQKLHHNVTTRYFATFPFEMVLFLKHWPWKWQKGLVGAKHSRSWWKKCKIWIQKFSLDKKKKKEEGSPVQFPSLPTSQKLSANNWKFWIRWGFRKPKPTIGPCAGDLLAESKSKDLWEGEEHGGQHPDIEHLHIGSFWQRVIHPNKSGKFSVTQLLIALFDISISNIDCRYIDTFEKYRYRYGHFWKYRYR